MSDPPVRARVVVRGRVQGVFFRAEAHARASSLGLAGRVRNLPDGSVEADFEGRRDLVEWMISWCGRGPSGASVEDVRVEWEEPRGTRGYSIG